MHEPKALFLSLIATSQLAAPAVMSATATPTGSASPPAAATTESCPPPAGANPAALQPNPYLQQAGMALQAAPNAQSFAQFMQVLRGMLAQPGMNKMPAAAIIKTNPVLTQLGVKVIDAGAGRVWTFPRINYTREVIVQWFDTKAVTTFVGRRHRIKRVSYTSIARIQNMILPVSVNLKEARIIGGDEGARFLVLVGDEGGSQLWLHAFKSVDGGWVDSPDHFASIPSFLTSNVSGKVAFRGTDMIFSIGRVVPAEGTQSTQLPEADSSTYRFLLKLTDTGYQLQRHVPDVAQFGTVRAFLEALANNRTDIARAMLADSKLLSIPRYVGVRGPSSTFRVVQMASPPSGAPRYRLITGQKDDLIFEIAKMKDKPIVRAIFIAPPDPFLQEIAKVLPTYEQLVPPPAPSVDTTAAEAKHP